jgi:hypothetical protein
MASFPIFSLLSGTLLFAAQQVRALAVPSSCDYLAISDSLLLPEAKRLADLRAATPKDAIDHPCVATTSDIYRDYPVLDTLSSDDVYAFLLDSLPTDTLRPLTAVGRIPAGSLSEARRYVDKVEAYETRYPYGPGAFTYGFSNDDELQHGGPGDLDPILMMPELHEELWNGIAVKPFVRRVLSIEFPMDADDLKLSARDSLIGLLNAGAARFYFIGHTGSDQWADERVFKVPEDLALLEPKALPSIASVLGPRTADFADDRVSSTGTRLLFHPDGVIAYLGAVGDCYPIPNNKLFKDWDDAASKGGTLGAAFMHAKIADRPGLSNALTFALLGDPALTLHIPAFDLKPASGSGRNLLKLEHAGSAGDSVYYQVVRVDSMPYNAVIAPQADYLKDRKYLRESILGEGRAVLAESGTIDLNLPAAPDSIDASVKVMTWNGNGMRYGHFTLSSLGPAVSVVPAPSRRSAKAPYRLILNGNRIRIQWNGIGPGGRTWVDVKGAGLK